MKKLIIFISSAILVSIIIVSCGAQKPKKAEDIDVSKLKTVCDFVDAVEIVVDEIIVLKGDRDWESFTEEDIAEIEKLVKILEEIDEIAEKKFTNDEAKSCPSYERVKSKMSVLDE